MRWIALCAAAVIGIAATGRAEDIKSGALTIEAPWVRASAGTTAGVFLTVRNDGEADRLAAVTTESAAEAKIDATVKDGDVMKMRPVDRLPVPAHGNVALTPGGYHIMLMGLKGPLKAGDSVSLTLRFEKAGPVRVVAEVLKSGSMGPMMDHQTMK